MRRIKRRTLGLATAALALVVPSVVDLSTTAQAANPHVILVCNGSKGCPKTPGAKVYKSLGEAVSHSVNGDWVLVWPGTYKEAVEVTPGHGLTSGLHIRGMARNSTVLDGTGLSGSGIHVSGVHNTWVENLTGQHYKAGSANAFYWTGVDGYWGRYLTGYDNGDYGVYAYDSTSSGRVPSAFAYVYGSWNADSGIYIGGCRDCHAVITDSKAEKNALGYSGTNAGGELVIMNSEWDHNAAGILPNTLQSEPDLPQRGVTIVNNWIHDNNDKDVPGAGITAIAPLGTGIGLSGGWNNIVRDNLIENNKHTGVLMHWLFTPPFENQVINNRFRNNATSGMPGDADIAIDGTALQNCVYGNKRIDKSGKATGAATTDPPGLGELNNCTSANPTRGPATTVYEPGDPIVTLMTALNAFGVTETKTPGPAGPRPQALKSMPNPCDGVPNNPWCTNGKLRFKPPTH